MEEKRGGRKVGWEGRVHGKGGGGGGREDLFLVGLLVTLNERWYQFCWGKVFAHLYPGFHRPGGTLTHEGWRELVK